jgi:hypothetical protein
MIGLDVIVTIQILILCLKFDDETLQTGVPNPMVAADLKPYYKWKENITVKPLINYTIGGSC